MTAPTDRALPDVGRLRALHEVARHGTIASAARSLGVTPSAISQQLTLLEKETGASLLDRGPRGVSVTGAGAALVERARAVLAVLEETRTAMDQLGGDLAGTVRIGSIASVARAIVLPAADRLALAHPDIRLAVTALEPAESVEAVAAGTLEVAVIDHYAHVPVPFPDYLQARTILTESLVLIAPPDFVGDGPVRLADLQDTDWVIPPDDAACGAAVRHACRAQGFEPRIAWETDDLLLLVEAVSRGQGVSLLPRLAVADDVAPIGIFDLAGRPLERTVLTIARATTQNRPIVRAVLEELVRRPA